ncbi:hypothetical protein HEK616_36890 [Streptomyces nigrescens]|uniref:Uncharacterized protein n=1 Tax=Streptomyces nigrescens TaxID=1920 RepID=A0ABN6QVH6_STRNI|nr:hypothetical protein HEK616_36890 [Streptomyces nigrescens]
MPGHAENRAASADAGEPWTVQAAACGHPGMSANPRGAVETGANGCDRPTAIPGSSTATATATATADERWAPG